MKYEHIVKGEFVQRPNRFIAYVDIDGHRETVHVKNTGRCRELLTERAEVYLEKNSNPQRKTAYDLVAVQKGELLINMDSQAPNRAVEEWLLKKALFPGLVSVRPETKYGNSRFDFYIETEKDRIFMEVKGVTLEQDGVVLFPDAPSERALKHVDELIKAAEEGFKAFILFVVQMKGVKYFTPNRATQPELAEELLRARKAGVTILAYDCLVTRDGMTVDMPVPVRLEEGERGKNTAEEHPFEALQNNLEEPKENFSFEGLQGIPKPLLKWYDTNRRILPWREEVSTYRIWISEIMLQQTRVEAVKPYFERFMQALPDVAALAQAPEEELLKLWEGLGYYSRARNLQTAAVQVQQQFGGSMPSSYEELLTLKGIGSYTAGAIASIAFGQPVPAVDGNVLRVVSRILMDDRDILNQAVKSDVERKLAEVLPLDRPGDFNQAMMELGAMVCIPVGVPHCGECPLSRICLAHHKGVMSEYPKKKAKKARKTEDKTILVIRDAEWTILHKRPDRGLLAGMYEFPSMEGHRGEEEVVQFLDGLGLKVIRIQPLGEAKHIFTHKEWHMLGYMVRVDELTAPASDMGKEGWIRALSSEAEERYPIPSAFAPYTGCLDISLGIEKYKRRRP